MEVFKEINGFPDYEISNLGRVRSKARYVRGVHHVSGKEMLRPLPECFLKIRVDKDGYNEVSLYEKNKMSHKRLHRLIAEAFIKNPNSFKIINHIDANKQNNSISNLEWCTDLYNKEHAIKNNLNPRGSSVGTSKLNESSVLQIKKLILKKTPAKEIAKAYSVSLDTIYLIGQGRSWKHVNLKTK